MLQKSKSEDIKKNCVAARENSERRRAIFDQTFQFIGLTQANGILIEVDRITLNFCGITREEVIDRPFWEAPLWQSKETRAKLQQAIASAAAGETVRYEEDVLGAGDTIATINLSIKPIKAEGGLGSTFRFTWLKQPHD
ncbi:MAG: PAS domain S-box protein [Rhizonema sp. NSF051]|nr:PAS domain S-box protein [Rhizonema sp. NSF051]